MWLMRVHTLPAASQPRNGLQPILVVVSSTQEVQVPILARAMTHRVMTMTMTRRAFSKLSLAARLAQPAMRMG